MGGLVQALQTDSIKSRQHKGCAETKDGVLSEGGVVNTQKLRSGPRSCRAYRPSELFESILRKLRRH